MASDQDYPKSENALKEEEILAMWERDAIFQKTLQKESPRGEFVFYEGPPGANGRPGIHHVISRVFKDVIPRYKTMRGFHVRRKAGWDTHGLPVELDVEKQLGFTSKKDIEEYGVEAFNEKCKESVWKYLDDWYALTRRIGYWVDLNDAYVTYYPEFIESVWNVVKKVEERGLLYKDYKVVPWCPRCGTGLSSHELAQGYADVKDISVYVKFKLTKASAQAVTRLPADRQGLNAENVFILAWTTTPWTLPGNVALAVGPNIEYVCAVKDGETVVVAKERAEVLGEGFEITKSVTGQELVGLEYEPLFPYLSDLIPDKEKLSTAFKIYAADFVTTTDGTGVVHTAVMYGQDDFELGTKVDLPKFHLVDETGHFIDGMGELSGLPVKDREDGGLATAVTILKKLQEQGSFFKKESVTHTYPHCWRCKTPLIYYARDSWYIRMSALRDELVEENKKINWIPSHIRDGRFGEWLREVKDWAVSRDRYWGTPLPVWQCLECEKREVIGSVDQLLERQKKSGNRYIVMRHGEAQSNALNVMCATAGSENDTLTDTGREEVHAAAKKLASEKIDAIIASPFGRTRQTAEIIAHELGITDVVFNESIGEIKAGTYDGKTMYEFLAFLEESDWYEKRFENGESYADIEQRMARFIFDLDKDPAYRGKTVLVITHGGPAQMLFAAALREHKDSLTDHHNHFSGTADFHELPFVPYPHDKNFKLDLHKPYIDEVILECSDCKNDMRRTPEVMDVWFDSGAMPFAQDHYPFENKEWVDKHGYPADYISEAIDQTRGWFYTLHAVGALMGKGLAFKNVICLTHILDAQGKKMSKSLGNVVNPWEMIAKYGIDVIRFWMFSVNQPGDAKNFDEKTVAEVQNKVFTLLRNVVKFYELYEQDESSKSKDQSVEARSQKLEAGLSLRSTFYDLRSDNVLDQWIITLLHKLIADVTNGLSMYDTFGPTRAIREFANDLSTWYIRRSRDRFKSDDAVDRAAALATTRYILLELSKCMAPFTPFFAEEMYQAMAGPQESVHLESWTGDASISAKDEMLLRDMQEARDIVSRALEARMAAGIKVRQPLASLKVTSNKLQGTNTELLELIKDEINVKEIIFDDTLSSDVELDTTITPELKREGDVRELIRAIQDFRKEQNLSTGDRIDLTITTDADGRALIDTAREEIMKAAGLSHVEVVEGVSGFVFSLKPRS